MQPFLCHPDERRISSLLYFTNGSGCFLCQHDSYDKDVSRNVSHYLIDSFFEFKVKTPLTLFTPW